MRIAVLLLMTVTLFSGCDRIRGWWPGTDGTSTMPSQGCDKDLTVYYKNNCGKTLIVYFTEVNPGTTVDCNVLQDYGSIYADQSKTFTIHKGKIGFFVFALDQEGKCTGGHRKAEAWVNCSQSSSNEASFNICQ